MGRGSSGANGGGGGGAAAKQQQNSAVELTRQEQEALDRRQAMAAADDLNDDYNLAMDTAYAGLDINGDYLSKRQGAINSIVGQGILSNPSDPDFSTYVKETFKNYDINTYIRPAAQKAAQEFGELAESFSGNASQFYRDMQTFSNMVAKYYKD